MTIKKLNFIGLISLLILISIYSCETKTSSDGNFDHIIVFSDSSLYGELESKLDQIFDKFIYTPHSERSFLYKLAPLELLDSYKKRRNIIFIGVLNQDDPISEYVKKMLSPEIQERVKRGEIFEIFREDMFAYDQLGLIICAADKDQLFTKITEENENIFNRFEEYHFNRLNKILFSSEEQVDIEEFLTNQYGWSVRIPYSYQVVERSIDSNFVWIKRTDPSRSLFIYRTKGDPSKIQDNWIINVRDSLATKYFDGDSISIDDTNIFQTEFMNKPAIKMVGIWQNHQLIIGGPFRTTVFYESGYIYFIDISVVAPGKRKKPFLDQLEVITRTFKFNSNMNE